MQFNLKTTLKAYPKLSPSILENYVTKEQFDATVETLVDYDSLNTILQDFVTDVEVEGTNIIYGRVKGQWVPVVDIPEQVAGIVCWGMINSTTLNAQQLLELSRQNFLNGVNEYSVENTPTENGYFWFASTSPIKCIVADNGLTYRQPITEGSNVTIEYKGQPLTFYCYRTQKLVALPNTTYRFKVSV